jgi:hypothetical protein
MWIKKCDCRASIRVIVLRTYFNEELMAINKVQKRTKKEILKDFEGAADIDDGHQWMSVGVESDVVMECALCRSGVPLEEVEKD